MGVNVNGSVTKTNDQPNPIFKISSPVVGYKVNAQSYKNFENKIVGFSGAVIYIWGT